MTPEEAAVASAEAISGLSARFMLDAATYIHGGSLGFEGMSFYAAGRGGVLGDVAAEAVTEAFVFFHPDTVKTNWEAAGAVMSRDKAAIEFANCAAKWGDDHLPDDLDASTLAALAKKVAATADATDAPIFAGWRALPEPSNPKGAAVHNMNSLRELRFARHANAVIAQGIAPEDAMSHRSPHMLAIFGWGDPVDTYAEIAADWNKAEDLTNAAMAEALSVLSADELNTFVELANAAYAVSA